VLLLVEDNDDDADLTVRAFKQAHIANPVVRARDGVEALDYLFRRGEHANRPITHSPSVVLLDLNLPRLNGFEVLQAIRADERTNHLPVVVLTASDREADRTAVYEQQGNCYVRKPVEQEAFLEAARQLGLYWLVLNVPAPPKRTA